MSRLVTFGSPRTEGRPTWALRGDAVDWGDGRRAPAVDPSKTRARIQCFQGFAAGIPGDRKAKPGRPDKTLMLIHGTSLGMSKDGGGAFLIHYSLWFIRSKAMLAAQNEDRTESARRPEIVVGKAE